MAGVSDDEPELVDESIRRPWRTPRLPPLVGAKGACEILGVQKMTLSRWMQPGSGVAHKGGGFGPDKTYMITPARVDSGPVWVRSDVERFAVLFGRQRASVDGDSNGT